MATVVCQGLQSCLESPLVEPRTVRLKLSSSRPHLSQALELDLKSCLFDSNTKEVEDDCSIQEPCNKSYDHLDNHGSSNPESGGWSFLQAISTLVPLDAKEKENTYVHPLVKRSSSALSEKSLELCTENLGNETGTDIIEGSIFSLPSSDSEGGNLPTGEQTRPRQLFGAKKVNPRKYPPPLTTISGSQSLRVRPHREGGRLIIKAVKAPERDSCFHAERSHGRLRISFLKNATPSVDTEEAENEDNEDNEGSRAEHDGKEVLDNDTNGEEPPAEVEEESLENEEESDGYVDEEMDGNYENDTGMEKFERPTRCKEGDQHGEKRLLECKTLWVATS